MTDIGPGGWQERMMGRIESLGLGGFAFGPWTNWWPLGEDGKRCAGPFHTPAEFDVWLSEQESHAPSA